MSDTFDFLAALFAAHDGPIAFDLDNKVVNTRDPEFVQANLGTLYISPVVTGGAVAFVFGVADDVDEMDWQSYRLKPTAVLWNAKKATAIACWAFDDPQQADEEVLGLARALGMEDFDDLLPLPGTGGWTLARAEENDFYTRDELLRVYGPGPKTGYPDPPKSARSPVDETPPWDDDSISGKYGDAVIMTPFDESDPRLAREIVVSTGANKMSVKWKPNAMPLGAFLAQLCTHREGPKDGPSYVLGDMVSGRRVKTAVKTIYAVGLDIDVGTPTAQIDAALKKFGMMAVRYSTHSHLKTFSEFKKDRLAKWADKEADGADYEEDEVLQRFLIEQEEWEPALAATAEYAGTDHKEGGIMVGVKHAPIPKHRLVFPFETPFEISKEGTTQAAAMEKWAKVPTALAKELNVPLDKSCLDPSRLFYFPRHAKGKPFDASLFGGPFFDWKKLVLDDPFEAEIAKLTKGTSKSVTEAGRGLGRWSMKAAHGFEIIDVLEEYAEEKLRHQTATGWEIECPFDEDHSNAGDPEDRACLAVSATDSPSGFFMIRCQHESCRDKTNLDMVGKMVEDGWFDRAVLDDEKYNAVEAEDAPNPVAAKKIEKEDKAHAAYMQAIYDLPEVDFTEADVEKVIRVCCEANLGTLLENKAKDALRARLGITMAVMNKMFKEMKTEIAREQSVAGVIKDPLGRSVFAYNGEYNFDEAYDCCFRALLNENKTADEPIFSCLQEKPVRMTRNAEERVEFVEITAARTMWAELNDRVTFVRRNENGADGARGKVPEEVANHVYEKAYERLPQTPEIIYTPLYTAEGELIRKPGWYRDLDLLMAESGFVVPRVYKDPSPEEVEDAVTLLTEEVLGDFPFLDTGMDGVERRAPSLANAMAMLITPFMRRMIDSCTPVFFVSKPAPGTGGTFLGMVPIVLFDGIEPAPLRYTQNEEEMQKALLASVMETRSHLFFDDVKEFNNRVLLMAITSRHIGGRLLGSSKNIARPNTSGWIATGNNPAIASEMERRICWIRMNAKTADIQNRTFRHPDYMQWLKANRGEIVHAILTLIAHWINCDMPKFTERKRASFEDWSEKVGGVLMCAGIDGFLDNRRSVGADMDEAAIKQFVREWLNKWGKDSPVLMADLWSYAFDTELDIVTGNNDDQKKNRFQRILPSLEGRTFKLTAGDFMVCTTSDADENTVYFLKKLEPVESALEPA